MPPSSPQNGAPMPMSVRPDAVVTKVTMTGSRSFSSVSAAAATDALDFADYVAHYARRAPAA